MKMRSFPVVALVAVLLMGTVDCYAENWIINNVDVPNKNLSANYYDGDSVKVHDKMLTWTEKFVLTPFGENSYSKHLSQYPACRNNIEKNGNVTYHKIDFEIKAGKFRTVAKRNYTNDNVMLCTDKEMGNEFDKAWYDISYGTPMYFRHYLFVTKYKLGDF